MEDKDAVAVMFSRFDKMYICPELIVNARILDRYKLHCCSIERR
jgi:hypothetical protein